MNNKKRYELSSIKSSIAITQQFSTSFTLGIFCLKKEVRNPIYGIYGFVRVTDEIVDTFHEQDQSSELDRFEDATKLAIKNQFSTNPVLHSFQAVVNKYQIDDKLIQSFFHSMRTDLYIKRHSEKSYSNYIYGSAEAVGLMCLKVFVNGNEQRYQEMSPAAKRLGAAFQKVNFLRDLKDDYEQMGRLYFPNLMRKNEFDEKEKEKIEIEIDQDFTAAFEGIIQLPRSSKFGVYLAYRYYKNLFLKLKNLKPHELFKGRIRIGNLRKLSLIPSTYYLSILNQRSYNY